MPLSVQESTAVERVAASPMLDRTLAWAAVNSGTSNGDGLATVAAMLADAFSTLPGDIAFVEPSSAERVTAEGLVERVANGKHLRLRVRPQAPLQLLFTGHMDTVYAADHAFQTITTLADGRINGPGVADMKGGLATMLAALEAVEESPLANDFGYEVLINSDEETGSHSSAALIAASARGKLAALTYEPALPDGGLAGARAGTGNFSIVVRGKSAHAGRNPDDGRNAVVAAADLAIRLRDAHGAGLSVNPARIDGGGPNNVVPELAVLRINFRPMRDEDVTRARHHIDATVAAVSADHDVSVEVHGGFNRPPKPIDAGAAKLFGLVRDVGADLGVPIAWSVTGGVCDGNNIAACGVPVVDTMGPRGGAIHSADEYLIPESLPERAALSAVTILRLVERGLT